MQPKWKESQTVLATYIPWTERQVPQKAQLLGAGVEGSWSNPRAGAAVACREMDRGDVREEIVMGSACGGKPGGPGSKGILLAQAKRVDPSP